MLCEFLPAGAGLSDSSGQTANILAGTMLCVWFSMFGYKLGSVSERGFSLLELLATIAIFSIISAIAFIGMTPVFDSFNLQGAREQFDFDVRRSQSEALREGARGVLVLSVDGRGYSFGFDYPPYNNPAVYEKHKFTRVLPWDMTITGSRSAIIFDSRGRIIDELEVLTTITFNFTQHGEIAMQGTLYPSGAISFD